MSDDFDGRAQTLALVQSLPISDDDCDTLDPDPILPTEHAGRVTLRVADAGVSPALNNDCDAAVCTGYRWRLDENDRVVVERVGY